MPVRKKLAPGESSSDLFSNQRGSSTVVHEADMKTGRGNRKGPAAVDKSKDAKAALNGASENVSRARSSITLAKNALDELHDKQTALAKKEMDEMRKGNGGGFWGLSDIWSSSESLLKQSFQVPLN